MKKYKNPISEYKVIRETEDSKKRKEYWEIGIGLNKVDNLKPSSYLLETAKKHIEGYITSDEVDNLIDSYYIDKNLSDVNIREEYECDIVSKRILDLLDQGSFTFSPQMLKGIHRYLFEGFDKYYPGRFRDKNIYKKEDILNGNTVNYGNYFMIDDLYRYDFSEESHYKYKYPFDKKQIEHLAEFVSKIWQVHPFFEGNTRTTAVFAELYLNNMGIKVNNEYFKKHADYFRGALVRSNYADIPNGISVSFEYLKKFFENVLGEGNNELRYEELKL